MTDQRDTPRTDAGNDSGDLARLCATAAARLREVLPTFRDPRHYCSAADQSLVRDLESVAGHDESDEPPRVPGEAEPAHPNQQRENPKS